MPRTIQNTAIGWLATAVMTASAAEPPLPGPEPMVPIAEEMLDTAITYCKQGEFTQAHTLLRALQAQLDPPPSVGQFISSLINGGCKAQWIAPSHWEMRATLGHDSNVNQGISSASFMLGDAITGFELLLDDSYRPVASAYAEAVLGHSQQILPGGPTLQLRAGARSHTASSASPWDLAHISATLTHATPVQSRTVELFGEISKLWLGGRHYQTSLAATVQSALLPRIPDLKIAASAQTFSYHTQPQQNSSQIQIGVTHPLHTSQRGNILIGATVMEDRAHQLRAGGHRTGGTIYLTGATKLRSWRLLGYMGTARWRSQQDFFPGLIDEKRRNRLLHLALKAEYPLTPSQDLQLNLQARSSRDNIALYTYKSVHGSVSWVARF